MSNFATESMHWYTKAGEAMYEVPRAGGHGMRPTTLADARKLGLVPSVTSIIRCAAAPQLTNWMIRTAVLSALTIQQIEGESSDSLIARIEVDRQEQSRKAAATGEKIHGAIERAYSPVGVNHDDRWFNWVLVAMATLEANCGPQKWLPERSFASPLGYGGKVDLQSVDWIVDAKTKDGELDGKTYDDHDLQLAAYRMGMGHNDEIMLNRRCAILFVSRTEPKARFVEIDEPDLQRGWNLFQALLTYWRHKNRYFP